MTNHIDNIENLEQNYIIQFKIDGVDPVDEVVEYAEKKIASLEKLINNPNDVLRAELVVTKEVDDKNLYKANLKIVSGSLSMDAIGHGKSAQAAIDDAKDELDKRIRRDKKKQKALFKKGARKLKQWLRFGK